MAMRLKIEGASDKAIAAYESALTIWAFKVNPESWRAVTTNIADLSYGLGYERAGKDDFKKAVALRRALVESLSKKAKPVDYAIALSSLGDAHYALNIGSADGKALAETVAVYQEAEGLYPASTHAEEKAIAQGNVALGLAAMGQKTQNAAMMREALDWYGRSATYQTRKRDAATWAATRRMVGGLHEALWSMEGKLADSAAALGAYEDALRVYSRDFYAAEFASLQVAVGNVRFAVWEKNAMLDDLKKSVLAFENALPTLNDSDRAVYGSRLGYALVQLARASKRVEPSRRAVEILRESVASLAKLGERAQLAYAEDSLCEALSVVAEMDKKRELAKEAARACNRALAILRPLKLTATIPTTEENLMKAQELVGSLN